MKRYFLFVAVFLTLVASVETGHAQHWRKIGDFRTVAGDPPSFGYDSPAIRAVFFLDDRHGWIALSSFYPGRYSYSNRIDTGFEATIFKTTDGGKSWIKSITPQPPLNYALISDIFMSDSMNGFAATSNYLGAVVLPPLRVWKTTDGGISWDTVQKTGPCSAIRPLASGRFAAGLGGAAVKDSLVAIITPAFLSKTLNATYTTDGGLTWTISGSSIKECWGTYYNFANDRFYICPESPFYPYIASGQLYSTSDLGNTWVPLHGLPSKFSTTGDVKGFGNTIYVQAVIDSPFSGIWRSVDGGMTFKNVGGPSTLYDSRFSVPQSCDGAVIVAADSTSIWMSTDGGDGMLGISVPVLHLPDFPIRSTCQLDTAALLISNPTCYPFLLDSLLLQGEPHFKFLRPATLPDTLLGGMTDTIWFTFDPLQKPGPQSATLHCFGRLSSLEGKVAYDSLLSLSATATPEPPKLTSSSYFVDLGSVSTCIPADTLIQLHNLGCDTLIVDSMRFVTVTGLTLSGFTLPFKLAPDSTLKLHAHYAPNSAGSFYLQVLLFASQEGLKTSTEIVLQAKAVPGVGALRVSPPVLDAGSHSFCGGDTTLTVQLSNTGCDTVALSQFLLEGAADFQFLSGSTDGRLPPDSSRTLTIRFAPQQKGSRTSQLVLHWLSIHDSTTAKDIRVAITGIGTGGTRLLSLATDTLDLGSIWSCNIADSALQIRNPGCDTLHLLHLGFDNPQFQLILGASPSIPPSGATTVKFTYRPDTTGHPLTDQGNLTIQTDADSAGLRTVPFKVNIRYPIHLHVAIASSDSATAGAVVNFTLALTGDKPSGIDALHFSIEHNDDLLEYRSLAGPGLHLDATTATGNGMVRQDFTCATVTDTGTLGTLRFVVNLAKAAATPLTLSALRFDTRLPIPPDCLVAVSDSSASFSYLYRCGDGLIQQQLRALPIQIDLIVPNPTDGKVSIAFGGSTVLPVTIGVFDLLGHEVLHQIGAKNPVTLDLRGLSPQAYYLRMQSLDAVVTRRIVVIR